MSSDPAFLFYSSDFLTGVSDLTFEERGQYITLLCLQHQKGRLTEKAIKIAVPNATADVLAKFEVDEKGLLFNERLEKEAKKRAQHAEKQRQRAKKGWEKRKRQKSRDTATANATALPLENENENVNENINRDEYNKGEKFNFKKSLLEIGVDEQIASDWLKVRSKKKASNTQTAFNQLLKQIDKSNKTANECVLICVENSWKGFKAEWLNDKKESHGKQTELTADEWAESRLRAIRGE